MQLAPVAGVPATLDVLNQLGVKIGTYVILVQDALDATKRAVKTFALAFRKIRKLYKTEGGLNAAVYLLTAANTWFEVAWKGHPFTFR